MAQNALETLSIEVASIFKPVRHLTSGQLITEFFAKLGYELPGTSLFTELPQLVEKVEGLMNAVEALTNAETEEQKRTAILNLLVAIAAVAAEIKDSIDAIIAAASSIPAFATNSEIDQFPRRLLDYLLITYLKDNHQRTYGVLYFIGLIDAIDTPADAAKFQPAFSLQKIHWERIPDYFTAPQNIPEMVYSWDTGFNHQLFITRLYVLLSGFALPGGIYKQGDNVRNALGNTTTGLDELRMPLLHNVILPSTYSQFGIDVTPVEQDGSEKPGFAILPYVFGESEFNFDLSEKFEIVFQIAATIDAGIGVVFRPSGVSAITNLFTSPLDSMDFGASLEIRQKENTGEIIIVGDAGGTRLALEGPSAKVFVTNYDSLDAGFEIKVDKIRLVVKGGEGDGFLATILGPDGIKAEAGIGIGYSREAGVYFTGAGALQIQLATHIELGPLEITSLTIGLKFDGSEIVLEAGAGLKLELGPLQAVVENMGIDATLTFPNDGGNLGSANLEFGFKPPNGVGLSIDAGVVKGGGYLFFDFDREEYAGALELTFQNTLSLKAIGIITTRMPDGSKGFSLLIIITAEFTVQLGYGFVFLGAGGLLGLHRTMVLQALAEGVRSGATANVLFPRDIVANAPRIISDLQVFFPVQQDHFLIGPMLKLGWGTPTLISISLGIVIEIKIADGFSIERIAILGVLKCVLPHEDAAILVLQVNFIGAIDFEERTAYFFAAIFESRILFMTIEGEMGVLVKWGEEADFLVSVGGFHPQFNPPPLPFPEPKRIAVSILNESWGRIRVEGYFAVTTNTVQFGARAELYFGFSAISIEGFIAFDALFQFNPFYFIISISGHVELKVFGMGLFSISLALSLEGPTPWRAKGTGRLKILFFSISANFDETWGESTTTTLEPIQVLPLITGELKKKTNWTSLPPASSNIGVTLRELPVSADEEDQLVMHPVGTLRVSQTAVPLDFDLDRVGSQKPDDASRFSITVSGSLRKKSDYNESFARAQFQDLTESEKLSSPAFEKEHGGVELTAAGSATRTGRITVRHVRYELVTIDTAFKRVRARFFNWLQLLFSFFLGNNAAALSPVSARTKKQYNPKQEGISVLTGGFAVANVHDNSALSANAMNFSSKAQAESYLATQIAGNPSMAKSIHVIPTYEVNTAA